jgi:hypothetical protein
MKSLTHKNLGASFVILLPGQKQESRMGTVCAKTRLTGGQCLMLVPQLLQVRFAWGSIYGARRWLRIIGAASAKPRGIGDDEEGADCADLQTSSDGATLPCVRIRRSRTLQILVAKLCTGTL